jgi:hypothetical protein
LHPAGWEKLWPATATQVSVLTVKNYGLPAITVSSLVAERLPSRVLRSDLTTRPLHRATQVKPIDLPLRPAQKGSNGALLEAERPN